MFFVFILYSASLQKFYAGFTADMERRIEEHNTGKGKYTSKGILWRIVTVFETKSRAEAIQLEARIKKRGIYRYLNDKGISLPDDPGFLPDQAPFGT
ncbi:MAG: GIY-YIG nuclease family protein [Chitinophagaceae bacterium]|nr:GIY-YIG nuclease family protein [Chitinophagaceae bacterium]